MAGGGGGGNLWIYILVGGGVTVGGAMGLEHQHLGPTWLIASLLGLGGLAVVFGSCEALIKSVEGIGQRLNWNTFVAGTMAGLASNLPEIVMLGFVVAAGPRVGFIVVALTLHLGALAFGIYSGLLPRDAHGRAGLPEPLVKLSTDLYAAAGAIFLATGGAMLCIKEFSSREGTPGLLPSDLYVIGGVMIFIEIVALQQLVKRFSKAAPDDANAKDEGVPPAEDPPSPAAEPSAAEPMPTGAIVGFGLLGIGTSVVGGHAVGDFAEILVTALTAAGYSEMFGALILSVFACAGAYVMIATAHAKGLYDIALANVSGAVTQVPFVVMPIVLILTAAFGQLGIIPLLEGGAVLPIDLQTTAVLFFAFPPMLILWKSIQDDGNINWLETASMVGGLRSDALPAGYARLICTADLHG